MITIRKKAFICAYISILLLNLILRYPSNEFSKGIDSFMVYSQSHKIIEAGEVEWILHPLSWFGLYPLSEEAGSPMLLSAITLLSDLGEWSLFAGALIWALIGINTIFLLTYQISKDKFTSLTAALVLGLSPNFFIGTDYIFGSRPHLIIFLYLFILLSLRILELRQNKYFVIMAIVATTMLFLHNTVFYVPIFLLSIAIFYNVKGLRFDYVNRYTWTATIILIGTLILLLSYFINKLPWVDTLDIFSSDVSFFSIISLNIIFQLIFDYAFAAGVSSLFIIFFFTDKFMKLSLRKLDILIFSILLICVPFIFDVIYFKAIFVPFLCILSAVGFRTIFDQIKSKNFKVFLLSFLIFSLFIPSNFTIMDDNLSETEIYQEKVIYKQNGAFINYQVTEPVIFLGANKVVGGYSNGNTLFDFNTDLLIHNRERYQDFDIEIGVNSVTDFLREDGQIYSINDWIGGDSGNYYPGKRMLQLDALDVDSPFTHIIFSTYGVNTVFIKESDNSSLFTESIKEKKYSVYITSFTQGYFVGNHL